MKILNLQQRSEEWFKARLGVITGSRASNVFKSNNLTLVDEMIAERMTQSVEESFTSKAMEHGILFEPEALKSYNERTKNSAQEIGFCVHDKYDWLAISPDALIFRDNIAVGAVEIKCPSSKKHIEYIRQNKIPNEYKHQIFHYFIVIETLQFLDFCSYDPRNRDLNTHIVRVTREEIREELENVFANYMKFYSKLCKYEEEIRSRL
jgi:putative phage-type endonuclease